MNEELYAIVEDGKSEIFRDRDSGDRAYIYDNWVDCKRMCRKLALDYIFPRKFHVVTLKVVEVEE